MVWTCGSFTLQHLFYFYPVFPFLISTSASKKSFLFSLSQKICSEVMLGVADHILHVREGSFRLYFMTVLGFGFLFSFFSVELPLLASVVMVIIIIIIIIMVSCSQISKLCIIYFIPSFF